MILQINKRKALEAISGLRSRIPALKTKEEENRDYQSWKDEAEESCNYATEYNSQHGGKPWKYILLPHDSVECNCSFMYVIYLGRIKQIKQGLVIEADLV